MGKLFYNADSLENFKVTKYKTEKNHDAVLLYLESKSQKLCYSIRRDLNEPDLDKVVDELTEICTHVLEHDLDIEVSEYFTRHYLYLFPSDGRIKKYTAQPADFSHLS